MSSVIHRAPQEGALLNLRELWTYRDLLWFLSLRDIKTQYRQMVLGFAWAIIPPFLTMAILSLLFSHLSSVLSNGAPYPLFVYAAILPWTFFANSLFHSTHCYVANADLIKKVYFPRLVILLSSMASDVMDFVLAFPVFLGMMIYFRVPLTGNIFWLPFFFLLAFLTALGVGLWLSTLNVKYRDMSCAIPFLSQFWFLATPVIYSSNGLSKPWSILYGLNPLAGVIEGFRWALLGTSAPPLGLLIVSLSSALLLLTTGVFYFRRNEQTFADVL